MSVKDLYLHDKCPTCGVELKETGDPIYFHCDQCGEDWLIEDLEFKPIQQDLERWLK